MRTQLTGVTRKTTFRHWFAQALNHVTDPGLMRIKSSHERSARGTATSRVVELRKPQSVRGELIEIGRLDFRPVTAEVRETHVVGHDENDVRTASGLPGQARDENSG